MPPASHHRPPEKFAYRFAALGVARMSIARKALDFLTGSGMFARGPEPITASAGSRPNDWVSEYRSIDDLVGQGVGWADNTGRLWGSASIGGTLDPAIVRDAYIKVATAWACIALTADAVSEAPLGVWQRVEGEPESRPDHPTSLLLQEPNPEQSGTEWTWSVVTLAATGDYAILEHVRNGFGQTIEIYPRDRMGWERRKTDRGTPYWETRSSTGIMREVDDEDVTIIPYQAHPRLKGYGFSPIRVIEREAGIEYSLTSYLQAFLDRGAIIPYVFTTDQPIWDKTKVQRLQAEFQRYAAGGALNMPPVLSGGLKLQQAGATVEDMAWPDLRGITELKIAQAFGVPPHLIGAKEAIQNGGLSTTEMDSAMTYLQRYTAGPLRKRIAGALTRKLLRERTKDRSWYIDFDLDEVLALQEDKYKLHERARADLAARGITVAEFRQDTKRPELPDGRGDIFLEPFNITAVPAFEDPPDPPPPAVPPAVPPPAKAPEKFAYPATPADYGRWSNRKSMDPAELERRAAFVTSNRKRQQQGAGKLEPKMRKFFRDQGKRIASTVVKAGADFETRGLADVDWNFEREELRRILEPHYDNMAKQAMADVAKLVSTAVSWDLANPEVQRIWQTLGLRIVQISETTRLDVAKTVATALDEGTTLLDLETRLYGMFEETYRGRSLAIARTESQVAYNSASLEAYRQSGEIEEVELFDNPDHDEDYGASDGLTCAQRDGLIVPAGDGQRHIFAEHPNGSMAIAPIVKVQED